MQLWFARGSEVSIREQLVTQVVLGILGDDLAPGQRLPSTRELARRFHLHPNTVSAGYRQLARERWVEQRRGSGVFVRASKPEMQLSAALALDQMIAGVFRSARKQGLSLPALRARLRHWLELQPPDHFLLVEPDGELRRIVAAEIQQAVSLTVTSCGLEDFRKMLEGSIPVSLPNRAAIVQRTLPEGTELLTLQFSLCPNVVGTVAARAIGRAGGHCIEVARVSETCAHHAERCRFSSRLPRITRRPQGELAAGIETDGRGCVRFGNGERTPRGLPRNSLLSAGRVVD